MFVRVLSFALEGIEAVPVTVEVDVSNGIPAFDIVGLPDAAVRESRERVRAAVRNAGWQFPAQRITVNLAPAYTRKVGAGLDLAIALGVLAGTGQLNAAWLGGYAVAGELALDGSLRPVQGALAIALGARTLGCEALVLPPGSAAEAALAGDRVLEASHLNKVVKHLSGLICLEPLAPPSDVQDELPPGPDLADVRGQLVARRALEVAAAGGHNLLLVGPPGAGKSLLARCLPGILPAMSREEAMEASRIQSVAGLLSHGRLLERRPYRAPHHCASRASMLGGGSPLRPGEITLSHRGVLFLDELPEFRREVLEGLRQPLEEGWVTLSRASGTVSFPARPTLMAACNPCPCGFAGDPTRACTCPPGAVSQYRARLSGPLLDRFDLQVFLSPVPFEELAAPQAGVHPESSATVRLRVEAARQRQRRRFAGSPCTCNAELTPPEVRRYCRLPQGGQALMRQAMERLGLSMRGYDRVLRVARTIADLAGVEQAELAHLAEALQYRALTLPG